MPNDKEQNETHADTPRETRELSELDVCRKERDEYLDMARRMKADFLNYKKDEDKRSERIRTLANLRILLELIGILDGFNSAATALPKKTGEAWVDGVLHIKKQLEELLNKEGVLKITAEPGSEFNPEYHESLLAVDSDLDEGLIVEEMRPGYELHGSVIRPVQVKVSKGNKT